MSVSELKKLSGVITADGVLDSNEVVKLRALLYADSKVSIEELTELFKIKAAVEAGNNCLEWKNLFIEACTDALLEDGVVDSEEAALLIGLIGSDNKVDRLEIALLVNICSTAESCDESLLDFALKAISDSILVDEKIDAEEVEMLRAVILGSGSEGGASVTKKELDLLFELHEVTAKSANCSEWDAFFVEAVTAAYLEDGKLDHTEAADLMSRIGADGQISELEKTLAKNISEKAASVDQSFANFVDSL